MKKSLVTKYAKLKKFSDKIYKKKMKNGWQKVQLRKIETK